MSTWKADEDGHTKGLRHDTSKTQEHYFLTYIDGKSHYLKVKLLRQKSQTCTALKELTE
ncbi:hypothetical protein AX17_006977 [Amanita inopinata Kibby_2008]|nr:hypothetical protein AX17_006977 [Amanita inopinata Kibby_2008]